MRDDDRQSVRGPQVAVLTFVFRLEEYQWLGICKELGIIAHGCRFESVARELIDDCLVFLDTLERIGERGRFVQEHNIEIYDEGETDIPTISKSDDPALATLSLLVDPAGTEIFGRETEGRAKLRVHLRLS